MEFLRTMCECLGFPKEIMTRVFNRKYPKMKDAVADGNISRVEEYYQQNYPISGEDENVLHIALQNKQQEMAHYILDKMDQVIIQDKNSDGDTPLMLATLGNNFDMVDKLIEKGALINTRQNEGATPFIAASANGFIEIAEYLLFKGANPYIRNFRGQTALHRACYYGKLDVIVFLLDAQNGPGLKLCKRDRTGNNCLHSAAQGLSINSLRYFMLILQDEELFEQKNEVDETVYDILERQFNFIKEEDLKPVTQKEIKASLRTRHAHLNITNKKCYSRVHSNRSMTNYHVQ